MTEALSAEITDASFQETIAEANRLGLTWQLRPATVQATNPVKATYDGDTEPISMNDLTGASVVGARVMVVTVPPAGNFIIGGFGGTTPGRLTNYRHAISDTDVTLTIAAQNVSGTLIEVNTIGHTLWKARGYFDFRETVAGTNLCVGFLRTDLSLDTTTFALFGVSAITDRATVSQEWSGVFTTPGPHQFQLRVRANAAPGGTQVCALGHTGLVVETWE